jgi:hypothetical protein
MKLTDTCQSANTVFSVTQGSNYYVSFGRSSESVINVNFTCTPVTRPSNDVCAGASNVTVGTQYEFDVGGASTDYPSTLACGRGYNEIFLKHTANCTGVTTLYAAKQNGSGSDIYVTGYVNGLCSILPPILCFDLSDTLTFPTDVGVDYYMSIGNYYAGGFDGVLLVNFSCATLPPTTSRPTRMPTLKPTLPPSTAAPTTKAPTTKAPTTAAPTPTAAPTTGKPTPVAAAGVLQVGLASLMGFLIVA